MPKDRYGREPGDKNYGKGKKKPRKPTHGATVSAVAKTGAGGKAVSAVARKKG